MRTVVRCSVCAVIVVGLWGSAPADAGQKAKNAKNNKKNNGRADKAKTRAQTEQDLAAARKKASEAQTEVARARAALSKALTAARGKLQSNPRLQNAVRAVASARERFERVSVPVLLALRDRPEYRKAVEAKEAADRAKNEGLKALDTDNAQRTELITASAEAAAAVGRIEQEALSAHSGCVAARKRLDEAIAALNRLRAELEAAQNDSPAVAAARERLAAAQQAAGKAAEKVRDAEKAHAQAANRRKDGSGKDRQTKRKRSSRNKRNNKRGSRNKLPGPVGGPHMPRL